MRCQAPNHPITVVLAIYFNMIEGLFVQVNAISSRQAQYGHCIAATAVHDMPESLVFLCPHMGLESGQMDPTHERL